MFECLPSCVVVGNMGRTFDLPNTLACLSLVSLQRSESLSQATDKFQTQPASDKRRLADEI